MKVGQKSEKLIKNSEIGEKSETGSKFWKLSQKTVKNLLSSFLKKNNKFLTKIKFSKKN